MSSLIGKARKVEEKLSKRAIPRSVPHKYHMLTLEKQPKFELHLKIYDLNNVPLVSGNSFVKWHLAGSIHAEHRGRTSKCPIDNHKVDYNFSKLIPSVRISMDKSNNLSECPLELEVLQEFAIAEKITLGHVRLNLSEYIEESEAFSKDVMSPPRKRTNSAGASPSTTTLPDSTEGRTCEDGIVRRYLMQDSKVNSTLKIGILMVQVDGERNFIAPALRTAPVFGGIAGLIGPDQVEDDTGPLPSISKGRDFSEVQDLYRRTLAASWARQPTELPADECIEDIFAGGNGWKTKRDAASAPETDEEEEEDTDANHGTLRPSDFRRLAAQHRSRSGAQGHHRRMLSASSDKSATTVTGKAGGAAGSTPSGGPRRGGRITREDSRESREDDAASVRSGSLGSMAPMGSSSDGDRRERDSGLRPARELEEVDFRDDLVAWTLPSVAA